MILTSFCSLLSLSLSLLSLSLSLSLSKKGGEKKKEERKKKREKKKKKKKRGNQKDVASVAKIHVGHSIVVNHELSPQKDETKTLFKKTR